MQIIERFHNARCIESSSAVLKMTFIAEKNRYTIVLFTPITANYILYNSFLLQSTSGNFYNSQDLCQILNRIHTYLCGYINLMLFTKSQIIVKLKLI